MVSFVNFGSIFCFVSWWFFCRLCVATVSPSGYFLFVFSTDGGFLCFLFGFGGNSTGVFFLCVDVAGLFCGFGGIEGGVFSLCFFGCVGLLFLFGLSLLLERAWCIDAPCWR